MAQEDDDLLEDFDPFEIFDTEAARLDRFFSSLDEADRDRPSRCAGWSVRDVLAHLAGEELYNHACLDGDIAGFKELLRREGLSGYEDFNEWCVRERRGVPYEDVLEEWRARNGETRRRMRELGRDATMRTAAGPYPVGWQTFHYDSEFATHADDVGAPVADDEVEARTAWRVRMGVFALVEQGSEAQVELGAGQVRVHVDGLDAELPEPEFVDATVDRLPDDHPLDPGIRAALRCLA